MSRESTAGGQLHGGLILVVEDDPLILEFLCEILQEEGYVVQAQTSADAASVLATDGIMTFGAERRALRTGTARVPAALTAAFTAGFTAAFRTMPHLIRFVCHQSGPDRGLRY